MIAAAWIYVGILVGLDVLSRRKAESGRAWRAAAHVWVMPLWVVFGTLLLLLRHRAIPAIAFLAVGGVIWRGAFRPRFGAPPITLMALALLAASGGAILTFRGWPPQCHGIESQSGVRRLDRPMDTGVAKTPLGRVGVGAYSVALSSTQRRLYVTYAHSGKLGVDGFTGIARIPIGEEEAAEFVSIGNGDVHRVRVDPRHQRVYALDLHEGIVYVFSEEPFRMLERIETGSDELTDVAVDPVGNRLYALDRSVPREEGNLLVYDLARPRDPLDRMELPPGARGSAEFVMTRDASRAFLYTEFFFRLLRFDFRSRKVDREATSWVPGGFLDGAVSGDGREVAFTNLLGFLQVRDTEELETRRTFWVRPGIRAIGVHGGTGKVYLADYFGGGLFAVDVWNGETTGRLRVGAQSREMAVSDRGFLYVPSVCGVFEVDTSIAEGFY